MAEHRGPTPTTIDLEFASSLDADPAEIWEIVTTMGGVNDELHPFIHMTTGGGHQELPATVVPGEVLFESWLLLFRVLPIDRHALALARIVQDQGFVEESTSWLQRRWRHERTLTTATDLRCLVTDRLIIEPRLRMARPFVRLVVGGLFRHRHRRLRRRFGTYAP